MLINSASAAIAPKFMRQTKIVMNHRMVKIVPGNCRFLTMEELLSFLPVKPRDRPLLGLSYSAKERQCEAPFARHDVG